MRFSVKAMTCSRHGLGHRNCDGSGRRGLRGCCHRGFTLVELLAVIAVIGIIASIAIPFIHRSLSMGQQTRCLANLRQLGIATSLYMNESKQVFPDINIWPKEIGPYAEVTWEGGGRLTNSEPDSSSPFMCPSAIEDKSTLPLGYNHQLSYGINGEYVAGCGISELFDKAAQGAQSATLLYADSKGTNIWRSFPDRFPADWHTDGVNAVFCDYHVENTGVTDVNSQEWYDLLRGSGR